MRSIGESTQQGHRLYCRGEGMMDLVTYFRSVMALSRSIVVTLDASGRVIHANTLLAQTTGYPLMEIIGDNWFTRLVPASERQHAMAQFRQCTVQEGVVDISGCIQHRDGHRVHIQWRLKPLSGAEMPGVMMVGQDITEHLSSRQDLITACADLLERNRELTNLYGVIHELSEPLANILGFAQLAAKAAGLPPQVAQDLEHIIRSSLHAREIIKTLMRFERPEPPQHARINLNSVVEEALVLFSPIAARRGVTVDCVLAPELPAISADLKQLKQVVISLTADAIQAMPEGSTLSIRTQAMPPHVILRVEDNGCAMVAAALPQVFAPFSATGDMDPCAGLGLSLAHGIIRAHGGSIDVHGSVESGTTVTVAFPLTQQRP